MRYVRSRIFCGLLACLITSSMLVYVNAVEDSGVSEQQGAVVTESGIRDESSTEENFVSEISWHSYKVEDDGSPPAFYIDLGGYFVGSSKFNTGVVDWSGVHVSVLNKDKVSVTSFTVTDGMYDNVESSALLGTFDTGLSSWEEGDCFYVVFDELPSIYTQAHQEIKVDYQKVEAYKEGYDKNNSYIVEGTGEYNITKVYTVKPELRDFNALIQLVSSDYKAVKGMEAEVSGLDSNKKVIQKQIVKSADDGFIAVNFDSAVSYFTVASLSAVNNEVTDNTLIYEYIKPYNNDRYYLTPCTVKTLPLQSETSGNTEDKSSTVSFRVNMSSDKDLSLFTYTPIGVAVYSDRDLIHTFTFESSDATPSMLVSYGKYTVKGIESYDYVLDMNEVLNVNSDTVDCVITAHPNLILKVVNEVGGKSLKAHFLVQDKEYSELSHNFMVNKGKEYSVKNLDTNAVFEVYIGDFKTTVLNIATGEVSHSGALSGETTNTSANNTGNNDIMPPKTGDVFGIVLGVMLGIAGVSTAGYLYYKRKGKKSNSVNN